MFRRRPFFGSQLTRALAVAGTFTIAQEDYFEVVYIDFLRHAFGGTSRYGTNYSNPAIYQVLNEATMPALSLPYLGLADSYYDTPPGAEPCVALLVPSSFDKTRVQMCCVSVRCLSACHQAAGWFTAWSPTTQTRPAGSTFPCSGCRSWAAATSRRTKASCWRRAPRRRGRGRRPPARRARRARPRRRPCRRPRFLTRRSSFRTE